MSQRNQRSTQSDFNGVTQWLIHHAAHRAPKCLCSRLEEEWLADSVSRSSSLSRLRFAVGCYWAAIVIVHEFPRGHVTAVSPVVAARGFILLADSNSGYFSLRSATLFLIIGIHAALFCGLITTLSHTRGMWAPATLQGHMLNRIPTETEITDALSGK
jgi:hypothetical protein